MNTARTPGRARAADASMLPMRARANGLRTKQAWSMPGPHDVVDEGAPALQQPGILDAVDPGTCVARRSGLGGGHDVPPRLADNS